LVSDGAGSAMRKPQSPLQRRSKKTHPSLCLWENSDYLFVFVTQTNNNCKRYGAVIFQKTHVLLAKKEETKSKQ
jgi:hypothetical protein